MITLARAEIEEALRRFVREEYDVLPTGGVQLLLNVSTTRFQAEVHAEAPGEGERHGK